MFSPMPIHRPCVGLSFGPDRVTLVQVRRGWGGGLSVRQATEHRFAPGLLKPSASEANVGDLDAVVKEVCALVRPFGSRSVAVSLPASSAYLAIFPFDAVPQGDQERRAILQWRFQHDERVTLGDAVIAYRVYPGVQSRVEKENNKTPVQPTPTFVLAVAIKRSILQQYQLVCERAGLFPVSIGLSALQLFELYGSMIAKHQESVMICWVDDAFVCIAFRQGIPIFIRQKMRGTTGSDRQAELLATLQYYDDQYPHAVQMSESEPVSAYVVGDMPQAPAERVDASRPGYPDECLSVGDAAWQLQLHQPELDKEAISLSVPALPAGGLSALASVVAA